MDSEAFAAIMGTVALIVIGAFKAARAIRRWRVSNEGAAASLETAMSQAADDARQRARQRVLDIKRDARRAHPVVHRWSNRSGRDGGEAA